MAEQLSASVPKRRARPTAPSDGAAGGGGPRAVLYAVVGGVLALVVLIVGLNLLTSLKAQDPGHIGVIQEGGPFDGRGVAGIKDPGTGVEPIGIFNDLRSFPATTRNYIISANPALGDRKNVDVFHTPTTDGVRVDIEGQALFNLNTDHAVLNDFYRKFGVRTFNGLHPYDGDDGWAAFLNQQFRPVLDNALREQIGKYDCAELNASCSLVQAGTEAARRTRQEAQSSAQNIAAIQDAIGKTLEADLSQTLGGPFFVNVRFRLQQITLPARVNDAVEEALAAKTNVQTQAYNADAAEKQALAAERLAKSRRANPYAGLSDVFKALPNGSRPIVNLNLGGGGRGLGLNVGR